MNQIYTQEDLVVETNRPEYFMEAEQEMTEEFIDEEMESEIRFRKQELAAVEGENRQLQG